ncbi:transposase [Planococcus faecalis]|nr:transposase [Planococcus faecalis]
MTRESVTDPDSGFLMRNQKPQGFFYLDHRTVEAVALDAGYFTGHICKTLNEAGTFVVMGYRRFKGGNPKVPKRLFTYVPSLDAYACPMGCKLSYATTDREGYRQYKSRPEDCEHCPLRSDCFSAKSKQRSIFRHIWEDEKEKVRANKRTPSGKKLYKLRSQTIERSFADAKELHSFRYARRRGRKSVQEQAYLTAAVQNIKKMTLLLSRRV